VPLATFSSSDTAHINASEKQAIPILRVKEFPLSTILHGTTQMQCK